LLFSPNAKARSVAGHQVIAAEAYRQLSPALKIKVPEILKAHPDYEKWKESFAGGSANLDLGMFIFMRASTWADEIKRRKRNYTHREWHYINYPLRPTKSPVEPRFVIGMRPPLFAGRRRAFPVLDLRGDTSGSRIRPPDRTRGSVPSTPDLGLVTQPMEDTAVGGINRQVHPVGRG
jgi:hypothetical protein